MITPDRPLNLIPGIHEHVTQVQHATGLAIDRWKHALHQFRARPDRGTFDVLLYAYNRLETFGNNEYTVHLFDYVLDVLRDYQDPTEIRTQQESSQMATRSILTPPGIASFINLQTPRAVVVGGELRYSLTIIFDKAAQARPEFRELQIGIDEALKEKWPARVPVGLKSPFRDAAEKESQYEGYHKGDIFISPWSKTQPGVIDARKQDILDWNEIYAGWLVRAKVRPFAYDQGGNKGCSFFLDHVQFLKPGKRLDGRKPAAESFPDDVDEFADEEMV